MRKVLKSAVFCAASATAALAATTPYDLIKPTWPLSWDDKAFEKFEPNEKIPNALPAATPANFKAGALMPDTVDQAYLDAINSKISPIRVNQAGYLKSDKERLFYFVGGNVEEFEVVDENGKSLKTKITGYFDASELEISSEWNVVAANPTSGFNRYNIDFISPLGVLHVGKIPQSVPTDKRLRIRVGEDVSSTFIVSDDVYTMVKDASLKFFGIQRSGNSDSWFHGKSHMKDGVGKAVKGESAVSGISFKEGDLQGGWYDAGDYIKESQSQAFAFMALAVMSTTNPSKDVDHFAYNQAEFVKTDNIPDVLREAKHGADFFLRSYEAADGVIDNMAVSVGNFSKEHNTWARPEVMDYITQENRGGAAGRDARLGELGSNVSADIAAGLAILAKDYAEYDEKFADSCLKVAEKMYDFAKSLAQGKSTYDGDKKFVYNTEAAGWGTNSHMGNDNFEDELALASVALLYATGKEAYLNDAIRTKNLFLTQDNFREGVGIFDGGWFRSKEAALVKGSRNTDCGNVHAYALYAFYKLILSDQRKAVEYGLSESERLTAIENVLVAMIANLGDISSGTETISLPKTGSLGYKSNTVAYSTPWYSMDDFGYWQYNEHQMGNIFEVLAYADVAKDLEKQGITLTNLGSSFKSSEMLQLALNQLNIVLGVNPWDMSFIYGLGDKNDCHPNHRISNPEGSYSLAYSYDYVAPVGGLLPLTRPTSVNELGDGHPNWQNYLIADPSLQGATLLLSALTIVSNGGDDYYEKKCDNCETKDATPFSEDNVYAAAFTFDADGSEGFDFRVVNSTFTKKDSVVAYVYFDATEEQVENCGVYFIAMMCQKYDASGFATGYCEKGVKEALKNSTPEKVDGTYNEKSKTYTWSMPFVIDTLEAGSWVKVEILTYAGVSEKGVCAESSDPAPFKFADGWSFAAHDAYKMAPAYDGAPLWTLKNGDVSVPPKDPYIVVRNKGDLLWGFDPTRAEEDPPVVEDPTEKDPEEKDPDEKDPDKKLPADKDGLQNIVVAKFQVRSANRTISVFGALSGEKVTVMDMQGRLVAQGYAGTSGVTLDVPRAGRYLVRVGAKSFLSSTRLVNVK